MNRAQLEAMSKEINAAIDDLTLDKKAAFERRDYAQDIAIGNNINILVVFANMMKAALEVTP